MTQTDELTKPINPQYGLEKLQGIYRGILPTDESPVGCGELEITITDAELKTRRATGSKIIEYDLPISAFMPMSRDELLSMYVKGSDLVDRSIGFSANGLKYVFLPDAADDEPGLVIKGNEMADYLGPTILCNPAQINRGVFDKLVGKLNEIHSDSYPQGCLPRLDYGGKLPEWH